MQKFIKNDLSEIRHFEDSVKVRDWIDLTQYRLMTDEEILKHETKPHTDYHIWNGSDWIDKRSQYPKLTRYQFLRCLLENGYKSEAIETQILTIENEFTRELTLLGFKEATNFVRTDESVIAMQSILNLDDEKVDAMWEYALTL